MHTIAYMTIGLPRYVKLETKLTLIASDLNFPIGSFAPTSYQAKEAPIVRSSGESVLEMAYGQ